MTTRLALAKNGSSKRIVKAPRDNELDDSYEMANLYPRDTGLPMTIWVSPRGRARYDATAKVCLVPGDRMEARNIAVVAIQSNPSRA
jgi:hypothetical protein